ncbi:MAG TPA: M28 family peptidase, partial [Pirellulales bacterium]|nr:M28 family peptidase [Pirellulales bacterium]
MLTTTVLLGSLLCVTVENTTVAQPPRVEKEDQDQDAGPTQETLGKPRSPRNPPMEKSFKGPLPELTTEQTAISEELRRDVDVLANKIGERNLGKYEKLVEAADFIEESLHEAGYERVERQGYDVKGRNCDNLVVELPGGEHVDEIVVVGAHYDSVVGTPGANDNGSGTAAMLALARRFASRKCGRTLRFVGWVNEEPPYFQSNTMGSVVYARRCRQRKEKIVAAISLETIGYYSDKRGSQKYPPPLSLLFPSEGNFIGFVSDVASRPLLDEFVSSFRRHAKFPSEKAALDSNLPGVGWSDHWSFWQEGYPGMMV